MQIIFFLSPRLMAECLHEEDCRLNNSYSRDDLWGWLAFAFGIIGFVSSWFIYGFGQVVDDVHFLREKAEKAE